MEKKRNLNPLSGNYPYLKTDLKNIHRSESYFINVIARIKMNACISAGQYINKKMGYLSHDKQQVINKFKNKQWHIQSTGLKFR
jgi:hypothetical protein